jgi:alpha-glucosidase
MWLDDAVVYEVYVRSFQDSDGDGVGDLRGVTARLAHVAGLGATAVWLSPIYPSPNADFGYDVSDYTAVDPGFGTLEDFDELVRAAHALRLKVLLDFVPCHTSIEHPWFREHPEYYIWADSPANNWLASFGGPAWALDPVTGRYYLHSFFPEQADVNWRNPALREAMSAALRFWLERGIDGFRLDALDRLLKDQRLRDDPPASGPPALPLHPDHASLLHTHSGNAPDIGSALRVIRGAVGDAALVGEVYLPASELGPYLEVLDCAFAFEPMQAGGDVQKLRAGIASALAAGRYGWVLSNHDFNRLGSRVGPENARAATLLLLSLPGPVFVFQGDEVGMLDAPAAERPLDRHGRDAFRRPMRWDRSANGGFTTGTPWLPVGDGLTQSVADQERDPDSHLRLVRRAIALRPALGSEIELLDSPADTVVITRGDYVVAVNLGDEPRLAPVAGELVIEARPGDGAERDFLPPHGGWIGRSIGSANA